METAPVEEMSVRELRAELADVINAAGMRDQVTFVTSRGRRVAAVVSVAVAEAATEDSQAAGDAATANDVRRQRRAPRGPGRHPQPDHGRDFRGLRH